MTDARAEAEKIVRDKGGVCLVPLPNSFGLSSHEKTFCDCEVTNMLVDAITRAYATGHTAGVMQFKTWGTDGCQSCETGRITLFVANTKCIQCDPKGYER